MATATRGSDVIIAGMGGQGALLVGKMLSELLMPYYEHVSWFPAYSTLMRGGPTECTVIFSHEDISSPLIDYPSVAVVMDTNSFNLYADKMVPGSTLILDSSIVKEELERDGLRLIKVPATEMVRELGSEQAANFVLLGVYLKAEDVLPFEKVVEGFTQKLRAEGKENFIELNTGALRKGWESVS